MSKIALVTGASRGLGFALAEALAKTHHVVAVARTTGALEDLDDKIQASGGQATLAPMDITNEGAMAQLCRSIYDRWGSTVFRTENPSEYWDGKDYKGEVMPDGAYAYLITFMYFDGTFYQYKGTVQIIR